MVNTQLILSSPDILGGTPVFAGTRVPIKNLIDYLEAGDTLDQFLDDFPSVSREHAVQVLELAKEALLSHAPARAADECLPKRLKREFPTHVVAMVQEMGWSGKKNGELMKLTHGQFDIFITGDQNLRYQQNLVYADVGVIVLVTINNRIETLKPLMRQVNQILPTIKAGKVIELQP